MRHRAAFLWIGLGLTAAFLLLCSCDEVERHQMLTFLFDGVPPLPGEANEPGVLRPNVADATGTAPAAGWYVHKPLSDCTACHGNRQRQGFSRQVRLVANVPELCHKCHQDYTAQRGWVHGPVAVGECLLCHEPHKSRNEFLLVRAAPELCYGCHDSQAIHEIEGHAQDSYARCNDCHEGHVGATKTLLKPAALSKPPERALPPEVRPESVASRDETPPEPAAAPQPAEERNRQLPTTPTDRYNSSVQAYHAGRFAEAREGFLEVLKSRSLPESMREMAKDYLEKIEWLQKEPRLSVPRPQMK